MQRFLTEEGRLALRTQHQQENNRRVEDRIKAVLLSDKGGHRQSAKALLIEDRREV
ncbi:hypothetical protein [Holospora undulata]|uniref:Transposase n=1 Tax=Holospora undulata HU1 TaxID=1321371 RepID=A0A061JIH1_9PROT|nr:hypothetical protein [Holospora undulata]ETZ05462.1 hypothetical protein K737_300098 [Holospora undulata HU1]